MKKRSQNFFEERESYLSILKDNGPAFLWKNLRFIFEENLRFFLNKKPKFALKKISRIFSKETGPDFLWRYLWKFIRKLNGGMLMDVLCTLHIQNWSRPVWYSGQFWWMPCIHEKGLLHLDIWIQYLFDLAWHFNVVVFFCRKGHFQKLGIFSSC